MSSNSPDASSSTATSPNVPKGKGSKGRPKGSQGESLIKRSREVLGLDRVRDIQRKRKTTKDSTDPEAKATTRREQVLEAQRVHRMRTKLYIKELESEVLRLRKSEAAAKAKVDEFDRQTQMLVQVLLEHGITPPSNLVNATIEIKPEQRDSSQSPWQQVQGLSLQPQANAGNVPGQSAQRGGAPTYSNQQQQASPIQLLPNSGDLSVVPSLFAPPARLPTGSQQQVQQVEAGAPFDFHNSQAEVDFILTLERPCMAHLHASHFGPHAPPFDAQTFFSPGARPPGGHTYDEPEAIFSGHVLTASMPLWQELRQQQKTTPSARRAPAQPIPPELTHDGLHHLLNTSYQLGLRGEMAPVQILEVLRARSESKLITVSEMRNLAVELSQHLQCHGFGAVFDVDIVRTLIYKYC